MSEYLQSGDLKKDYDRKYQEFEVAALGGKVVKIKEPTMGDMLELQRCLIKRQEEGEVADVSGLVECAMLLHNADGSPMFESIEKGEEVLQSIPLDQFQALMRAVKQTTKVKQLPDDAVVARAKNLEAAI